MRWRATDRSPQRTVSPPTSRDHIRAAKEQLTPLHPDAEPVPDQWAGARPEAPPRTAVATPVELGHSARPDVLMGTEFIDAPTQMDVNTLIRAYCQP